jgi:uncharacterized protein (TIGR03000 family)
MTVQGVAIMLRRPTAVMGAMVGLVLLAGTEMACSQAKSELQTSTLRVLMPQANASLTIQDQQTQQSGSDRLFVSPPLQLGKKYTYTLVAFWEPNNYTKIWRTRVVEIEAGQKIDVDLTREDNRFPDKILVRYVPTPQEIVDKMCDLAEIKKGEVVYDLGCGDGRLVITAVKKYGAKRGVGVDIDPVRIKECLDNAKKEGLETVVEFRKADVLKLNDISDANVVLLYMGEDLNKALRPILQKSLKPGSRVVSHRFLMGSEWPPEKSITVMDNRGEEYRLHLWNITGSKEVQKEEVKDDKKEAKDEKKE